MSIDLEAVTRAIKYGISEYDHSHLGQVWLKPVTILMVDELVPSIRLPKPKPYLWANSMGRTPWRKHVFSSLRNVGRYKHECMVDVHVTQGDEDPYRTVLTAESEGYSGHAALLGKSTDNDLMWDLLKLLLLPSPIRLFVSLSSEKYHSTLLESTAEMVRKYADADSVRATDDVWAIQFPTGSLDKRSVLVARWGPGRHKRAPERADVMSRG